MSKAAQPNRSVVWLTSVWIAYWCAMFALTHAPARAVPHAPVPYADKICHFVMYFGLVWLGGQCLRRRRRLSVRVLLGWMLLYALYGAIDEWTQPLVGRCCDLWDWISDLCGVLIATLVLAVRPLPPATSPDGNM